MMTIMQEVGNCPKVLFENNGKDVRNNVKVILLTKIIYNPVTL